MSLFSQQRTRASAPAPENAGQAPAGTGATTLFRRYRPLETLAQGGFGSVEICLDTRLQRRVAIKRIPLVSGAAETSRESTSMALAEARTASMLQHPNIVQVIDFTYDSAYAYLVMEYVDGMTLEQFLASVPGNSLTFDEAACIADALVQALSYAHENGVLHLDIKPANVLIDRSGHVKLTDFGMATLTSAAGFGGARGGTVGYMPPEQLRGEAVDERTDIFSLSCVLYEGLCARAVFRAASAVDSLTLINQGVTDPSELLPDLPAGAGSALMQALDPDPAGRMASVDAFGNQFLARLGNPREGRKSLARIIARLASDDPEATLVQETPPKEPAPPWERDPERGLLGTRYPRARRVVVGALGAAGTASALWWILGQMGVEDSATRGVVAMAMAVASFAAPQLGSALACAGVLVRAATASQLLGTLPALIVIAALCIAWWYVWGRTEPASSAVVAALLGMAVAAGKLGWPVLLIAPLAAYTLVPVSAAVSTFLGALLAQLALVLAQTGGLALADVGPALGQTSFLLAAVGLPACSTLMAYLFERAWDSYEAAGTTGLFVVVCLVPLGGVMLVLGIAQATGAMPADAVEIANAMGWGVLSSIMACLCVYMLGYSRSWEDGDRP